MHPTLGQRWLLTRSSTQFGVVDGKRVPVRTVGAMLDVTALRTSEQEHEQRAEILDATIDFVAIMQADGALVYLNRAARQFLGIDPGATLSRHNLRSAQPPESLAQDLGRGHPCGGPWWRLAGRDRIPEARRQRAADVSGAARAPWARGQATALLDHRA